MSKESIIARISEANVLLGSVVGECRAYCADESIPLADRWELFRVAPNKINKPWYETPAFMDSPYDELYLERYQTFDVVERLEDYQSEVDDGDTWGDEWGQKELDEAKNHYMTRYIGSWKYDW